MLDEQQQQQQQPQQQQQQAKPSPAVSDPTSVATAPTYVDSPRKVRALFFVRLLSHVNVL